MLVVTYLLTYCLLDSVNRFVEMNDLGCCTR